MIDNAIMNTFVAQITKQNTDRVKPGDRRAAQIAQVQAQLQQDEKQLATASAENATALRQKIATPTGLDRS
jgi:hypothetical protein